MQKVVVATDIHGSASCGQQVLDAFYRENADALILLGDIYYHGPRNPLPEGHGPMQLAELLNGIADKLICVKGNCDAEVDAMISKFEFLAPHTVEVGDVSLFLTHGHECVEVPYWVDVVLRGHYHVNSDEKVDGMRVLGLSSASLPKGGCEPCYLVIEGGVAEYKKLSDATTILTKNLK